MTFWSSARASWRRFSSISSFGKEETRDGAVLVVLQRRAEVLLGALVAAAEQPRHAKIPAPENAVGRSVHERRVRASRRFRARPSPRRDTEARCAGRTIQRACPCWPPARSGLRAAPVRAPSRCAPPACPARDARAALSPGRGCRASTTRVRASRLRRNRAGPASARPPTARRRRLRSRGWRGRHRARRRSGPRPNRPLSRYRIGRCRT